MRPSPSVFNHSEMIMKRNMINEYLQIMMTMTNFKTNITKYITDIKCLTGILTVINVNNRRDTT